MAELPSYPHQVLGVRKLVRGNGFPDFTDECSC